MDFSDLKGVPDDACDVLVMSRASYMIAAAEEFLDHARRIVRPGGVAVVDWLHGRAEAPAHYVTVLFREARYFYRLSGKFHLYLLTVLRPVGK